MKGKKGRSRVQEGGAFDQRGRNRNMKRGERGIAKILRFESVSQRTLTLAGKMKLGRCLDPWVVSHMGRAEGLKLPVEGRRTALSKSDSSALNQSSAHFYHL